MTKTIHILNATDKKEQLIADFTNIILTSFVEFARKEKTTLRKFAKDAASNCYKDLIRASDLGCKEWFR